MTIFLHCLFCAAVEMTGEGKTVRRSDIRRQTLRSLPAGAVILNTVFAPPNEYKLPASMSFRAGLPVDMETNTSSSIEALSREISCHNAACTIEQWAFSTSLRCGRNDRGAAHRNCHFERGCLPIWSQKYIYSIETLSREISHTNGTRTSGGRFLHFVETLHRVSKSAEVGL